MEWLILIAWIWAVGKAPGVSDALRKNKNEDIVDIITREYYKHQQKEEKNDYRND